VTNRVELAVYERRFRRSGLPLFIEDYSATHDVFTRAAPLFLLVFLLEMLGAISLDWPWWQNVLSALAGLVVLVAGFGLLNAVRGRPRGQPDPAGAGRQHRRRRVLRGLRHAGDRRARLRDLGRGAQLEARTDHAR